MNFLKMLFGNVPSMSATEAQDALKGAEAPFILDVREDDEYRAGHISGAKLIPLGQLSAQMDKLPKDRSILCVCASGSRSSMAARQLSAEGYQVVNLQGGMSGWRMAGLPIKKGK